MAAFFALTVKAFAKVCHGFNHVFKQVRGWLDRAVERVMDRLGLGQAEERHTAQEAAQEQERVKELERQQEIEREAHI